MSAPGANIYICSGALGSGLDDFGGYPLPISAKGGKGVSRASCLADCSSRYFAFTGINDGPFRSAGRISNSRWTMGAAVLLNTV
jgi:hypothetical protein